MFRLATVAAARLAKHTLHAEHTRSSRKPSESGLNRTAIVTAIAIVVAASYTLAAHPNATIQAV